MVVSTSQRLTDSNGLQPQFDCAHWGEAECMLLFPEQMEAIPRVTPTYESVANTIIQSLPRLEMYFERRDQDVKAHLTVDPL